MSERFVAFYSARPFWVAESIDLSDPQTPEAFHDLMQEIVFRHEEEGFKLFACRDGKILLQIPSLEMDSPSSDKPDLTALVRWWSSYLDYLNALYLLLDSCLLQVMKLAYIEISELTRKDAIRVELDGDKILGENIAHESYASAYQMGTFLSMYGQPPQYDLRMMMRQTISLDAFELLAHNTSTAFATSEITKSLSTITKALSEYKSGNYDLALVISWFVVESLLSERWNKYLRSINTDYANGSKRINSDRMAMLTEGRESSISVISNQLELLGIIPNAQFRIIDRVRGYRNKVVHQDPKFECTEDHAQESIALALDMTLEGTDLEISLNYSYGAHGP